MINIRTKNMLIDSRRFKLPSEYFTVQPGFRGCGGAALMTAVRLVNSTYFSLNIPDVSKGQVKVCETVSTSEDDTGSVPKHILKSANSHLLCLLRMIVFVALIWQMTQFWYRISIHRIKAQWSSQRPSEI